MVAGCWAPGRGDAGLEDGRWFLRDSQSWAIGVSRNVNDTSEMEGKMRVVMR